MKPIDCRSLLRCLALLGILIPSAAFSQSKHGAASASSPPGWGAAWLQPANEQQRQAREFAKKYETAEKAHDYRAEVGICDEAIRNEPHEVVWYSMRGAANFHLKQYDQALADINRALIMARERNLTSMSAKLLTARAAVEEYSHNYAAAAADLQESLKLSRNDPAAFNNLAWLRATAPDGAVRNGHEGVRLAQKAMAMSGKESYVVEDTLAAAYAEATDYSEAVASEKRAMADAASQITDAAKARKLQKEFTERLRLFEQHHPYHAAPTLE